MTPIRYDAATIRAARADDADLRDRDFADKHGISEAELVAAHAGHGVTRITAHPDIVIPAAQRLGEVMALTRNASCVHEKVGRYDNYRPGAHAAMVLAAEIDLRIFPAHWVSAFMVERQARRSLQVFDAAGDAVHKIHLRDVSDHATWDALKAEIAHDDPSDALTVADRRPPEAAKSNPDKLEVLRAEWRRMTDTHQFMRLTAKLKMNRLGAYRIAGAPFARRVTTASVEQALTAIRDGGFSVMIFVGNKGCIQIHSGPIGTLSPMGPWQNVMDPGFNLHLRRDHIAEVWAVEKPTSRGVAVSLEAFDADGSIILQIFGVPKEDNDTRPQWQAVVAGLQSAAEALA